MPINSTSVANDLETTESSFPPNPRPSFNSTPPISELVTKLEKAAAQKPILKTNLADDPKTVSSEEIITPKSTVPLCG